jgi:hypothetical protein
MNFTIYHALPACHGWRQVGSAADFSTAEQCATQFASDHDGHHVCVKDERGAVVLAFLPSTRRMRSNGND